MPKIYVFALASALLCSASVHALEITSHNEVRNINSGLEQRLESTKAALIAVVNDLKAKVDDLLARMTSVEADVSLIKNNGANDEVQRWNPKLENRLDTIEGKNTTQDTAINVMRTTQPISWNTVLESRLKALEDKAAPTASVPIPDTTNCKTIVTSSTKNKMIMCPAGHVLVGLANAGLAESSKNVYVQGRCCTLKAE